MKYIALLCFGNKVLTSIEIGQVLSEIKVPIARHLDIGRSVESNSLELEIISLVFQYDGTLRKVSDRLYSLYQFAGWEK